MIAQHIMDGCLESIDFLANRLQVPQFLLYRGSGIDEISQANHPVDLRQIECRNSLTHFANRIPIVAISRGR